MLARKTSEQPRSFKWLPKNSYIWNEPTVIKNLHFKCTIIAFISPLSHMLDFRILFSSHDFCKFHSFRDLKGLANFTAPFTCIKTLHLQVTLHCTQVLPKVLSMPHSFYNPACEEHWQTYDCTVPHLCTLHMPPTLALRTKACIIIIISIINWTVYNPLKILNNS